MNKQVTLCALMHFGNFLFVSASCDGNWSELEATPEVANVADSSSAVAADMRCMVFRLLCRIVHCDDQGEGMGSKAL